jgi:flagellar biosynthesis protein FliR
MPLELVASYLKLPVFALVAARLGGMLMFQPVLGALAIPIHFRVMLVVALAALLTPLVSLPVNAPDTPAQIALALGIELLLGVLLGLLTMACFVGLQLGGLMIAQESGIAFGQIVDPSTEEEESVVSVFYLQLAIVVYLIVGGHRALLSACLDTFDSIPLLGDCDQIRMGGDLLCRALTLSGEVAFRVAGPVLLALFLVNIALGFISRTMPQLNVLAVGFSLKSLLALTIMAATLPTAMNAFIGALTTVMGWTHELLGISG